MDWNLMIEYQQLFDDVSQTIWILAHLNVLNKIKLPARGPKGDPINEVRVTMFIQELINEIHRLRDDEGR